MTRKIIPTSNGDNISDPSTPDLQESSSTKQGIFILYLLSTTLKRQSRENQIMWNGLLGFISLLYYLLYVNEILQKSVDAKDYNIQ